MSRAHYVENVLGVSGSGALSLMAGATVHVYDEGTTTPIAQTIYDSDGGSGTLSNPLTSDANGKVEFWLATAARVDLVVSKTGFTSQTRTVDVEDAPVAEGASVGDVPTWDGSKYVPQAPSGGGSGLTLLGPFVVNYDDAGLLDGNALVVLATLSAGTIVTQAWAFITEAFTWTGGGVGFSPFFEVCAGDPPSGNYDAVWQGDPTQRTWAPADPLQEEGIYPIDRPAHSVIRVKAAASLAAGLVIDGTPTLTAGSAEVYALVWVPA